MFLSETATKQSINSIRSYASDLAAFAEMAKAFGGWQNVNQRIMTGYIHGDLFQKKKLSKSSISRQIETLKKFYLWVYDKGFINLPKNFDWSYRHLFDYKFGDKGAFSREQHSFNALYLSGDDFDTILAGVFSPDTFTQIRNEITLQLGYECGLRAHEVLKLESDSILKSICAAREKNLGLWATAKLTVIGKGAVRREIYLPPALAETIHGYIVNFRNLKDHLCSHLICTRNGSEIQDVKFASNIFSQAFEKSGLAREHRQGYHRLRKSFGTNLVNECYAHGRDPWVEVPRRLGHKSINTTMKYIQFDALLNHRSSILSEIAMRDEKYLAIHKSAVGSNRS